MQISPFPPRKAVLDSPSPAIPGPRGETAVWFLCGQVAAQEPVRNVPVHISPFRVGRRGDVALTLTNRTVSGTHAELEDRGDHLLVRDLQSTNGTFVNGTRIQGEARVGPDDLLHFADVPFRVRRQSADVTTVTTCENVCDRALALVQFDHLISNRAVTPHYQPIVSLADSQTLGFEVLGRSQVLGLESPAAMFHAAAQLDLEVELSRMLRWEGIRVSTSFAAMPHLFVNTHPRELDSPGLVESMRALRDMSPRQPITLEVHEAAITNPLTMRELRAALAELDIRLAYDDFGEGQHRLIELVKSPPDYLKFDISLIRGIDRATAEHQQMVETLVRMTRNLGVTTLAEGVETDGEASVCRQIGFELAQGFLFGRPASINAVA